jgi:23S rRNA pseudouridine1911/1915/1917 synthase
MTRTQSQHPTIDDVNEPLIDDLDLIEEDADASAYNTATQIHCEAVIDETMAGLRIDQVAASVFNDYSRERLKGWLADGQLTLDGQTVKPKTRVNGGEVLRLNATLAAETHSLPQAMDLNIVYEDDDIIVINKPVGLVVHPGAGNWDGTLVNGLLHHDPRLAELPRAGIVHRIDKDTSGLLVIARNLAAQHHLSQQLEEKSVYRVYDAVVVGHVIAGGTIDEPIRRHAVDRLKMNVQPGGRPSVTHYRVTERFGTHTLLRVQLETGRTHQIRVHMAYMNWPLVGDGVYGGRVRLPRGAGTALVEVLQNFRRQALHARELGLVHPATGEQMLFEAAWPEDFVQLVQALRDERRSHL